MGIESKIKDGNLYEYATIHSSLVSWEHEEHKKNKGALTNESSRVSTNMPYTFVYRTSDLYLIYLSCERVQSYISCSVHITEWYSICVPGTLTAFSFFICSLYPIKSSEETIYRIILYSTLFLLQLLGHQTNIFYHHTIGNFMKIKTKTGQYNFVNSGL